VFIGKISLPAVAVALILIPAGISTAAQMPTAKRCTISLGIEFVRIEPGEFMMGVDAPFPRESVTSTYYPGGISWYDALAFCRFRVVLAPPPDGKPLRFEPPNLRRCVKQKADNSALTQLPNGDLLAFYYNRPASSGEHDPDLSIIGLRLRYGAVQWDMPSAWPGLLDADDEAPIVWNDNGTIWLFRGCPRMKEAYSFQYNRSTDNGATWGPIEFPVFEGIIYPHSPQPINSAFRGPDQTIYVAVDSQGPHSELYAGKDDGLTWLRYGRQDDGTPFDLRIT